MVKLSYISIKWRRLTIWYRNCNRIYFWYLNLLTSRIVTGIIMKTVYKVVVLLLFATTFQFCSKSVEYANSNSTTNTNTNTGNNSSGPSTGNPASTPYSPGQSGVYFPGDSTKITDTSKSKTPTLYLTVTKTSPCSATGELFNFVCTGNSAVPSGATFMWYMGDGNTKSTNTVSGYSYIYPNNNYHVVVQAFYGGSIIATKDTTVKAYGVFVKPTASFTITQPLSNNLNYIYCTNTTMSNVTYTNAWDFDDGSTATATSPTHTYPNVTTDKLYRVRLVTKADSTGCTDTAYRLVTIYGVVVNPSCSIYYSSHDTCGPGKETFNFTAVVSGVPVGSTYYWSYGDGTTDAGSSVTKQFVNQNTYTVTLTFNNSNVTCNTIVKANGVNNFPTANFTYTVTPAGNTFNFQDSTIMKSGSLRSWFWDFGDSSQAHVSSPQHTYIKGLVQKKYTVLYGVAASNGCVANVQKDVIVPPL